MVSQDNSRNSGSVQRAKVYRLNVDGNWDDQGTGHVTVDYLERSEDFGLFVIDEEDNETLLLHRISSEDIYRKREDTIISWKDPEFSTELALSFQAATGCSYIWDHICNVQRNMHLNSLPSETFNGISSELNELPHVELSTLPLIHKIAESGPGDPLRVTDLMLQDKLFFKKLMELFRICEDLENIDGLHLIFKIVRGIILLNSSAVFEKIFGDDLIMDIIGCLEYDPDASQTYHRNYLKEHVVFKEAIPIKDALALSKIHQNYRLGYLKDVILSNVLDEGTVGNLNSIIHANNAIVISLLKDDKTFIKELFARLKSHSTSIDSKKNLVNFLHEFCTLSKSLQMTNQQRLFGDLVAEGIFDIISDVFLSDDYKLVLTGTDILILFHGLDPNSIQSYVTRQDVDLLGLLVKNMLKDSGDDRNCQFLEILRSLIDPQPPGQLKENVVKIFYEKHLSQLIDVIASSCLPNTEDEEKCKIMSLTERSRRKGGLRPEMIINICDLLCLCVLRHPCRIKCNFLRNNAIDKVLYLTRRREKYLVLAAIRFVRALVSRSDEHLMNHIVRNNLFKPIVDVFCVNHDRYNLLNSAVLALFECIRKENLKVLVLYLVDTFWDQLSKFETLSSINALKVKYQQLLEGAGTGSTTSFVNQRKRLDERALEKEEEDYFNENIDEENSTSARSDSRPVLVNGTSPSPSLSSGGLVDYDDDEEDDEDYKPPPKKLKETTEEDNGFINFPLKRKSVSKDHLESKRLRRLPNVVKSREGVLAALCSSAFGDTVLHSKKVATKESLNMNQKSLVLKNEDRRYSTGNDSDNTKSAEEEESERRENDGESEVVSRTASRSFQVKNSDGCRKLGVEIHLSTSSYIDQMNESDDCSTKAGADERPLMAVNGT